MILSAYATDNRIYWIKPMIDFSSLFILAGIMFGLIAGDAALYADTLRVQLDVPQNVSNAGFTGATAESMFLSEAARIVRGESIIPVPSLRVSTGNSIITALAKPLNLDGVVTAIQEQFGINHLMVTGAILAESATSTSPKPDPVRPLTSGVKLDMALVVHQPNQIPVQTVLEQPDGDVVALVNRSAGWAMEQVSPYRVVLTHFIAGVNGSPIGVQEARNSAKRFLSKPFDPTRATERAMTHNVLALADLIDNKVAAADAQLEQTLAIPGVMPQARALLTINHAFIAIAQRRLDHAATVVADKDMTLGGPQLPQFDHNLAVLKALIAWGRGDVAAAEAQLRAAVTQEANSEIGHHYLAQLLRAKGDLQGAAAEEQAALIARRFERKTQALAMVLFWTDPINGGITLRQ